LSVRHDREQLSLQGAVALSAQVLADAIGDAICPRDERLPEARHLAGQLDFNQSPGQDPLIPNPTRNAANSDVSFIAPFGRGTRISTTGTATVSQE